MCEYDVEIGLSYRCSIISMTNVELRCLITNGSMLSVNKYHDVRVARARQGYLRNLGEFKFRFLPSIFNVYPTKGMLLYVDRT